MSTKRKKYDEEFKRRVVRASYTSERPLSAVAESYGIHISQLHRWRKQYTPTGEISELSSNQAEIRSLRNRIAELEEENYILKKASAYFAKHQK